MGLNILIVDDSSTMRKMVIKTIKMSGVPVNDFFHAGNGQEGLEQISNNWVDVVFVDINMPVMTGLEMIDHIKKDPDLQKLPIVVISTESSSTRIQDVQKRGVNFIHKPFTPEKFREIVTELLGDLVFKVQVHEEQLMKIAGQVLETMAFAIMLSGGEFNEDELRSSVVRFKGHFSGAVVLSITLGSLRECTLNMLGDDEEVSDKQMVDALGELTNVICGNLLSELAGPEPVFDLQAPEILLGKDESSRLELNGDVTTSRIMFYDGWAEITVVIDNEIAHPQEVLVEDSF